MNNRPHTSLGVFVATKEDVAIIELLGGISHEGVGFTKSQVDNLWKLYGFQNERDHNKDPQDTYRECISVGKREREGCEKALQDRDLEFTAEEHGERVNYTISVPRGFSGMKVSSRSIGGWSSSGDAFRVRSWEELRKAAVGATNFEHAGSMRNMFRAVQSDGLRIMALLSKFVEPGEDPLRVVCEALADIGYDVPYMDDEDEEMELEP